ncbi:Pycsar system effector family protein [Mesorhizobium sp. 1B3]|uniref:Pycsar system effector family protein n=1 Tax=Mesorhizobium sp. 1B3 TaxID=3243599 RepID=UPI003D99ACF3
MGIEVFNRMKAVQDQPKGVEVPAFVLPKDPKLYLDHLRKINDVFYDQIRIADQKAAYIFTFMIAFLVSSTEGRGVFTLNRYLAGDPVVIFFSAALAVSAIVSMVSSIMVVLPRHRTTSTSLYWGGWPANRAAFIAAHDTGDPEYLFREYIGNVDNLSAINRSKYRLVTLSFRALIVTVVAYILLLGMGAGF